MPASSCDWLIAVGVGSCAVGIFIYSYRHASKFLNLLQAVEVLDVDKTIYEKVKSAGGTLPYVAINGKVSADGKEIHGLHETSSIGVVRNIKIKENRGNRGKWWITEERTVSSSWSTEPFSLVNKSTEPFSFVNHNIRVSVNNPRSAYRLSLTKVLDHYEAMQSTASEQVLDYIKGENVKGIRTIEKMLISNSILTVIGELKLTADGKLTICASSDDFLKYYITHDDLASVIDTERGVAAITKLHAIVFFVIAGGCVAFSLYKRYKQYSQEQQYLRLRDEMEQFDSSSDDEGEDFVW